MGSLGSQTCSQGFDLVWIHVICDGKLELLVKLISQGILAAALWHILLDDLGTVFLTLRSDFGPIFSLNAF